ncbi:hypothetical protein WDW86_18315 [Bdellovibrionota bacterium FG-2]
MRPIPLWILLCGALFSTVGSADENLDRAVDQAALETQESSIAIIKETLAQKVPKGSSVPFLERLLELYRQNATILFRVDGGKSASSAHTRALRNLIATATRLISDYPGKYTERRVLFLRGQAFEELQEKTAASADYLRVAERFSETNEGSAATLSLADFAIAARKYTEALRFLHRIEARPSDPRYGIALYRLAWVSFNLSDPSTAFDYSRKLARLFADKTSSADRATRENILLDSSLFYLDALERGLPGFSLAEALPKLSSLNPGPVYGKMLLRLAQLLRSHGRESDLAELRKQVVLNEPTLSETIDIVLCSFEHGLNRQKLALVRDAARDFKSLGGVKSQKTTFPRVQAVLSSAFEGLQKEKHADLGTLGEICEAYRVLSDPADPKLRLLRFNLAEAQFSQGAFAPATGEYQWVYEHPAKDQEVLAFDAGRRALASRYQEILMQGLIPKDLKPQPLDPSKTRAALPPLMDEWIRWTDEIAIRHPKPLPEDLQHLQFECARAAYQQGAIRFALDRLRVFATTFPSSRYAAAAASLTLDTAQLANDWVLLESLAKGFLKLEGWNPPEFVAKLQRAEGAALVMAGNAALGSGQKEKALGLFSRSLEGTLSSDLGASAHLGLALIHRDAYQFLDAFSHFQAYFSGTQKHSDGDADLRAVALQCAWLSGSAEAMEVALSSKQLCSGFIGGPCAEFRARQLLSANLSQPQELKKEIQQGMGSKSERLRLLWSVVALRFPEQFRFSETLQLFRQIPKDWMFSEDIERLSILASLSQSAPVALTHLRVEIAQVKSPLVRLKQLKEFEEATVQLAELPHSEIRNTIVHKLILAYADTVSWIKTIKSLESLIPILEKKSVALAAKAPARVQDKVQDAGPAVSSLALLETLDPKQSWEKSELLTKWLRALEEHNWAQAIFLIQELERKKSVPAKKVSLMRTAALLASGGNS